jgi:hypothetical protein
MRGILACAHKQHIPKGFKHLIIHSALLLPVVVYCERNAFREIFNVIALFSCDALIGPYRREETRGERDP